MAVMDATRSAVLLSIISLILAMVDAEIGADIQLLPDEGFVSLGDINIGALGRVHNYNEETVGT